MSAATTEREELPYAAMRAAVEEMRRTVLDLEVVLVEMAELRGRYEKRQKKGRALLAEMHRAGALYLEAAKLAARDARARRDESGAAEREERARRLSVASFRDPEWRKAMGFGDENEGVFGDAAE